MRFLPRPKETTDLGEDITSNYNDKQASYYQNVRQSDVLEYKGSRINTTRSMNQALKLKQEPTSVMWLFTEGG